MDVIDINQAVQRALAALGVGKNKDKKAIGYSDNLIDLEYAKGAVFGSADIYVGKIIYVTTDSGTFKAVEKTIEVDGEILSGFGNIGRWVSNIGGEEPDTGESFVGIILEDQLQVLDFNKGSKIILYEEIETIHPIDPKFIPAFDSITLNGADGKQYKLSVDESGTLVHTAIEGA